MDAGEVLIKKSLAISERLNDHSLLGTCYQSLAFIDQQQDNRDGAIELYREALHHFELVQSSEAEKVRTGLQALEKS